MANKELERSHLEAWMAATSMLAGLRPDDCESPDFIVRDGGQVLGIEVTEFAYPEQPGYPNTREQSSLRSRVIQDALEFPAFRGEC